jgi:hypothetical protein
MPTTEFNGNFYENCECSNAPEILNGACLACEGVDGSIIDKDTLQKKIWNQVRVPSSLYSMNKATLTIDKRNKTTSTSNQASDRNESAIQTNIIPTRGNSTKGSITRMRPGSSSPGGTGVDVKHNSYARYLAKKKGTYLKTQQNPTNVNAVYGNKNKMIGILNQCKCPQPTN